MHSTGWSWEQDDTAREQETSIVPETSASVPSCSLLAPFLAGERRTGKEEGGVRAETHLWTFLPPTYYPGWRSNARETRLQVCSHHL